MGYRQTVNATYHHDLRRDLYHDLRDLSVIAPPLRDPHHVRLLLDLRGLLLQLQIKNKASFVLHPGTCSLGRFTVIIWLISNRSPNRKQFSLFSIVRLVVDMFH